jgi:hypothetical protein
MYNMDNNQLQRRIEALEKWQKEKQSQQISFPLDNQSIEILNKYFMRITANYDVYTGGAGGNIFPIYIGNQGGQVFEVSTPSTTGYSVNVSTNYITTTGLNIKYFDDEIVTVATTGTAPSPLILGNAYFVINSDGFTFQLSETESGAAIDITDTGSGSQFIRYF